MRSFSFVKSMGSMRLMIALSAGTAIEVHASTVELNDSICRTWTPSQWEQFRTAVVDPKTGGLHAARIKNVFENCLSQMESNPAIAACMKNLQYAYQLATSEGKYSPLSSNSEYINNLPKEIKSLPEEFAKGLPDNWREIAKNKSIKWNRFTTRAGPENRSEIRTVMELPEDKNGYKQYLLYIEGQPNVTQMIGTKGDKIYFGEFRSVSAGAPLKLASENGQTHGAICLDCHSGGLREIIPKANDEGKTLLESSEGFSHQAFNKELGKKALPNWEGYLNASHHAKMAPHGLGSTTRCTDCHNGAAGSSGHDRHELIPALFYYDGDPKSPTNQANLYGNNLSKEGWKYPRLNSDVLVKVLREQSMPPKKNVDTPEPRDIVKSLAAEIGGGLKAWVMETSCTEKPNTKGSETKPANAPH